MAAVLAFHAGFGWAAGGYLGVSAFFTLSGFLITTLLLEERERTGGVDLARFWSRRARRLLPAALVTLAAICLAAPVLATPEQLARLRGDVLASLASVVNWRFAAQGRDYGRLFSAPSPVLHFWSLAIEAQFYVVFPLLVARARRVLVWVVVAVVAAGVTAGLVGDDAAAYYSTLARAPELLAGSVLALVLARPAARRRLPGWPVAAAGVVALLALLWAWSFVPVGSAALFRGALLAHAAASAVVVAAAVIGGPLQRVLSVPPLAWLGRVSYGAYLFHWPIFIWLTPERAGFGGLPLVGVEVAATLALATASLHLLELPVRRGRRLLGVPPRWALGLGATLVVGAATLATVDAPAASTGFTDGVEAAADRSGVDLSGPSPPGLPRVAVFGDSTALRTVFGLPLWGIQTRRIATVGDETVVGCGLGREGMIDAAGTRRPILPECRDWPERWRARVAELDLDGALLQVGPWDVADRRLPGSDEWQHVGQPAFDEVLKQEMRTAVDVLSSSGATVLWLTSPRIELERSVVPRPPEPFPASDPARMARLNQLIAEVAAERPHLVRVIDVARHLRDLPGGELDPSIRPDGVHVSEEASGPLAAWLGPAILDALAQTRSQSFQTGS